MALENSVRPLGGLDLHNLGEVVLAGEGVTVRVGIYERRLRLVQHGEVLRERLAVTELEDGLCVRRQVVIVVDGDGVRDMLPDKGPDMRVQPRGRRVDEHIHRLGHCSIFSQNWRTLRW